MLVAESILLVALENVPENSGHWEESNVNGDIPLKLTAALITGGSNGMSGMGMCELAWSMEEEVAVASEQVPACSPLPLTVTLQDDENGVSMSLPLPTVADASANGLGKPPGSRKFSSASFRELADVDIMKQERALSPLALL